MYNINMTYGLLYMSYIENMLPIGQSKQTADAITVSRRVFVHFEIFAEKGELALPNRQHC